MTSPASLVFSAAFFSLSAVLHHVTQNYYKLVKFFLTFYRNKEQLSAVARYSVMTDDTTQRA
jgi:hypothetical protein